MKELSIYLFSHRLSRYLIVGIAAFSVEYISFILLTLIGMHLIAAQILSFSCGLLISFTGNRKVTFIDERTNYMLSSTSQLWRYTVLAIINLTLSTIIIHRLVNDMEVEPLVAKLVVMMTIITWNYLVFSKIIFRTK